MTSENTQPDHTNTAAATTGNSTETTAVDSAPANDEEVQFEREPKLIQALEKVFNGGCILRFITSVLPNAADQAVQFELAYHDALAEVYAAVGSDAYNSTVSQIDFAQVLDELNWTERVDTAVLYHYDSANEQIEFAVPFIEELAQSYATSFATGIADVTEFIAQLSAELLGTDVVIATVDGLQSAVVVAGEGVRAGLDGITEVSEAVIGEAATEGVGEVLTEVATEALPLLGLGIGVWRLGRGARNLTFSAGKACKATALCSAGYVAGNKAWKKRGSKAARDSASHCMEGVARCNSGMMAIVGQAPGMCLVTIPVAIGSNVVADRCCKARKQRKLERKRKEIHLHFQATTPNNKNQDVQLMLLPSKE